MLKKKVAQVFPKVAQNVASPVWLKKQCFSPLPKKSPDILATSVIKFVAKKCQNLVALERIKEQEIPKTTMIESLLGLLVVWCQPSCNFWRSIDLRSTFPFRPRSRSPATPTLLPWPSSTPSSAAAQAAWLSSSTTSTSSSRSGATWCHSTERWQVCHKGNLGRKRFQSFGQSYKRSTIVIYES